MNMRKKLPLTECAHWWAWNEILSFREEMVNDVFSQDKNLKAKRNNVEGLNKNNFGGSVSNIIMCCAECVLKAKNTDDLERP